MGLINALPLVGRTEIMQLYFMNGGVVYGFAVTLAHLRKMRVSKKLSDVVQIIRKLQYVVILLVYITRTAITVMTGALRQEINNVKAVVVLLQYVMKKAQILI